MVQNKKEVEMSLKEILSRGVQQLRRKKNIRQMERDLSLKREELALQYHAVGEEVIAQKLTGEIIETQIKNIRNLIEVITQLDQENIDFQESIELKKVEYEERINEYIPLIDSLKENMINPKNSRITQKELLEDTRNELKTIRLQMKTKEKLFKNNEEIKAQTNEEHELNDEKRKNLITEQEHLDQELISLRNQIENRSRDFEKIREQITIIDNELKTTESQITTYKKEIARLKKEKVKEIDTIKKLIQNNRLAIDIRNQELSNLMTLNGKQTIKETLFPEELKEFYQTIEQLHNDIQDLLENRHQNAVASDREDPFLMLGFLAILGGIILSIIFIIVVIVQISSSENTPAQKLANTVVKETTFIQNGCRRATLIIPMEDTNQIFVKSAQLLTQTKSQTKQLMIQLAYPEGETGDPDKIEIYRDTKLLESFTITPRVELVDQTGCMMLYLEKKVEK